MASKVIMDMDMMNSRLINNNVSRFLQSNTGTGTGTGSGTRNSIKSKRRSNKMVPDSPMFPINFASLSMQNKIKSKRANSMQSNRNFLSLVAFISDSRTKKMIILSLSNRLFSTLWYF